MKEASVFSGRGVLCLVAALIGFSISHTVAEVQSGQIIVQGVEGEPTYSVAGGAWLPLKENVHLTRGTVIKTSDRSSVDLVLQYNGTVLRLTPNSTLSLDKLNKESAGEETITETSLNLLAGSIVGSQRKLASPSKFEINVPGGTATIVGTEYLVRADGSVIVLSGTVTVNYNLPHNGGSVKVTVPAGYRFDPVTGQVVPFSNGDLHNIIADVNTVRRNAQVFKTTTASGQIATVVVKPEGNISPTKGNNGVGNGIDPQPPGNPPINDGPGTGPGNPGNGGGKGHKKGSSPRRILPGG